MKPETIQEFNDTIVPLMAHAPPGSFGEPVSEEAVHDVEKLLGIGIPDAFKLFLMRYGCTDWPDRIYGVGPNIDENLNLVQNTLWERHESGLPMDTNLLPFSPDGWGNHHCFKGVEWNPASSDPAVYFWSHETGQYTLTEFADFFAWLRWLVKLLEDI